MTTDENEARWKRRKAAVKAVGEEAYDLFLFLCEIDSEEAMQECTAARAEVFHWVFRRPEHKAAISRAYRTE